MSSTGVMLSAAVAQAVGTARAVTVLGPVKSDVTGRVRTLEQALRGGRQLGLISRLAPGAIARLFPTAHLPFGISDP